MAYVQSVLYFVVRTLLNYRSCSRPWQPIASKRYSKQYSLQRPLQKTERRVKKYRCVRAFRSMEVAPTIQSLHKRHRFYMEGTICKVIATLHNANEYSTTNTDELEYNRRGIMTLQIVASLKSYGPEQQVARLSCLAILQSSCINSILANVSMLWKESMPLQFVASLKCYGN
jgi:hypothetical protein